MKQIEISRIIDYIFRHTLGKYFYFTKYAPGINIIGDSNRIAQDIIRQHYFSLIAEGKNPTFLDIGARNAARINLAANFEYHAFDINPQSKEVIYGDICNCPEIEDETFDVVFSFDVFEHLKKPWDAANECIRITKRGGIIICRSLFSYRYHPEPVDYWRFSSQCLEYLFIDSGQTDTIISGYDITGRRRNRCGLYLDHRPPIDWLGGFRENWQVLWIGRKRDEKGNGMDMFRNWTMLPKDFVTALYRVVLGREPDPEGLAVHTRALQESGAPARVLKVMLQSEEYRNLAKGGQRTVAPGNFFTMLYRLLPGSESDFEKLVSYYTRILKEAGIRYGGWPGWL
jgi:SAM-dependent methyltransferase